MSKINWLTLFAVIGFVGASIFWLLSLDVLASIAALGGVIAAVLSLHFTR